MDDTRKDIYFSDTFKIGHPLVDEYGALDISLVCDNPAFVDPFLIFANPKYKTLHDLIVRYLKFLRDISLQSHGQNLSTGVFNHYYKFPEVKQAWLGYSVDGNSGLGLGKDFGESLYKNLHTIFSDFGDKKSEITDSSHLEKLCLVEEGVGVDKISDFTLNLIKKFLLEYTEKFAAEKIDNKFLSQFPIRKVEFDFENGTWKDAIFTLPTITHKGKKDFVLLVPREILTKHDTWISRNDFLENDTAIFNTIENDELRMKINKFFCDNLQVKHTKKGKQKDYSKKSKRDALIRTITEYPDVLDYYIKYKEKNKKDALKNHVAEPESINFFPDVTQIQKEFRKKTFGQLNSFQDCTSRITFFKQTLESNSRDLYFKGAPLHEDQLRLMFKNVTYGSIFDYNSEVDNGQGPIDFIISYGSQDKTGLELKRASNTKLKQNLLNQGKVYQKNANLKHVIKIIFYFSDSELMRVNRVLSELSMSADNQEIFLIDCRKKESGSNQR